MYQIRSHVICVPPDSSEHVTESWLREIEIEIEIEIDR